MLSLLSTIIYFIACHGGAADHFSTFAEDLERKGHQVQIYATGPALQKFQDRNIKNINLTEIGNITEKATAIEIAKKCVEAAVVITDVGHEFDVDLQNALREHAVKALRIAYYDNPERYVPGGYSSVAAKVMLAAQKVLFANANHATGPIYQNALVEIDLPDEKRVGLGYYSMNQANKVIERKHSDRTLIRSQLFSGYSKNDQGQQILFYVGGNNDEYFSKAFPAFLQLLAQAVQQANLSHFVILLQQHPGAKEKKIDTQLLQSWKENYGSNPNAPQFFVSKLSSEDAQVVADKMLYYQTSMAPQFVLAGIPTIQVGHETYQDLLVENGLCSIVTDRDSLLRAFTQVINQKGKPNRALIQEKLGFYSNWSERLIDAINSSDILHKWD